MSADHNRIADFVNGELSIEERREFRKHLATCEQCQQELGRLLEVDGLASLYFEREGTADKPEVTPNPPAAPSNPAPTPAPATSIPSEPPTRKLFQPRWDYRQFLALGAAVAALVAVILYLNGPRQPEPLSDLAFNSGAPNLSEPRTTYKAADIPHGGTTKLGAGDSTSGLPNDDLAKLKKRSDFLGMAAAYLAYNNADQAKKAAEQARKALEGKPETIDVLITRAAVLIKLGSFEQALPLLEKILDQDPKHPQAHWNRALALSGLGLNRSAAKEYADVARYDPNPSWASEAQAKADALQQSEDALDETWKQVRAYGDALVASRTVPPPPPGLRVPDYGIMYRYFYDAVRTRQSAAEVRELLPLARELDDENILSSYVERISRNDFRRRAPLAERYAKLRQGVIQGNLPAAQRRQLAEELFRSGEDDIAVGALVLAELETQHIDEFEERARKLNDPWFTALALQRRASVRLAEGNPSGAEQYLKDALRICQPHRGLGNRCADAEIDMIHVQNLLVRLDQAKAHAEASLEVIQRIRDRALWTRWLEQSSQIAKIRHDSATVRAYLDEALYLSGNERSKQYIHRNLLNVALQDFDFTRARNELDQALNPRLPLPAIIALDLTDVARVMPGPQDEEYLLRAEKALPGNADVGERAMMLQVLGRFYTPRKPQDGQKYLRDALDLLAQLPAEQLASNALAGHARAGAYSELIVDAGKRGDYAEALDLFGKEMGFSVPNTCVVALTQDSERSLVIVRGKTGELRGYYDGHRTRWLWDEPLSPVPADAVSTLRACEKVDVIARPPLHGLTSVLPPDIAWSHRVRAEPLRPLPGKPRHLVVSQVAYQANRKLPQFPWPDAALPENEEIFRLGGRDATPGRVLEELETANEADLATHGVRDDASGTSFLYLAPDSKGQDLLTVQAVQKGPAMKGAPFIVLAACEAGQTAPAHHEPLSLPWALLQKGARGVLAASVELPDTDARPFFDAIRERMRKGAPPAVALRDERVAWLSQNKGTEWVNKVLLFE